MPCGSLVDNIVLSPRKILEKHKHLLSLELNLRAFEIPSIATVGAMISSKLPIQRSKLGYVWLCYSILTMDGFVCHEN